MRNGSQYFLAPISQRQCLKQCFKSGLVLYVEYIFEFPYLSCGQFHPIDNSTKEIHTSQIDLKRRNTEPLERLDRDQQDFDV